MLNDLGAALIIGALIAILAWTALRAPGTRTRARHRRRALDDAAAETWTRAWRPGPGDRLAVLRLRRGLRRWIPAPRRLP